MELRWSVLILGIGVVFLSLICLALILSIFKHVFVLPSKISTLAEARDAKFAGNDAPSEELVAVIVAAISAMRGEGAPAFRISRIDVPVPTSSTPAWGMAERGRRPAPGRR